VKLCPRSPTSGWACKCPRRRSRRTTGTGSGLWKVPGGRGNLPAGAARTTTKPGADAPALCLGVGPRPRGNYRVSEPLSSDVEGVPVFDLQQRVAGRIAVPPRARGHLRARDGTWARSAVSRSPPSRTSRLTAWEQGTVPGIRPPSPLHRPEAGCLKAPHLARVSVSCRRPHPPTLQHRPAARPCVGSPATLRVPCSRRLQGARARCMITGIRLRGPASAHPEDSVDHPRRSGRTGGKATP